MDENDVIEGQEGELIVQSPVVSQGYFDNEKATNESFTADGLWFKTGDIGLVRDGMFYVVDRKKVCAFPFSRVYDGTNSARNSSNTKVCKWRPPSSKHIS